MCIIQYCYCTCAIFTFQAESISVFTAVVKHFLPAVTFFAPPVQGKTLEEKTRLKSKI